jgi:hypothetical protein
MFTAERKITSCRPSTPADNITGSDRGRRASQSGFTTHGGLSASAGFPVGQRRSISRCRIELTREWK